MHHATTNGDTDPTARRADDDAADTAEDAFDAFAHLREGVSDAEERAREFIQERPLAAFFMAVAAGYFLARLGRRWL